MPTLGQAYVARLDGMGANLERGRWTSLQWRGAPVNKSPAYFQHLRTDAGLGWIRGFFGWSPSHDVINLGRVPNQSDLTPYFDGIETATSVGMPVRFDYLDVCEVGDFNGTQLYDYLDMVSLYASMYRFSRPELICFGAINEPASPNGAWNAIILRTHSILRSHLPANKWVLSLSHENWNDPGSLPNAPIASDTATVYDVHYYPKNQPSANGAAAVRAEWAGVAASIKTWQNSHGNVPVLIGEAGLWNTNDQPYGGAGQPRPGDWPAAITALQAAAGEYRPAPWAIADQGDAGVVPVNQNPDGSYGSANGSADLNISVQAAFLAAGSLIKLAPYFTTTPGVPTVASTITVNDPGTLVGNVNLASAPWVAKFVTDPPLTAIEYALVHMVPPNYPFYGTGVFIQQPLVGGKATVALMFEASGDICKYGPVGGPYVDTKPVTIIKPTDVVTGVTVAQLAAVQAELTKVTAMLAALKPLS